MRPHCLLAYDVDGNVTHTLDYRVAYDPADPSVPLGLYDFAAMEQAGTEMTTIWTADGAVGSKVWPEWLGIRAHEFRVELEGPPGAKRIAALVHKYSGHRRERDAIDTAITDRIVEAGDGPADLRDLVGGPDRPIKLDDDGGSIPVEAAPLELPIIGAVVSD